MAQPCPLQVCGCSVMAQLDYAVFMFKLSILLDTWRRACKHSIVGGQPIAAVVEDKGIARTSEHDQTDACEVSISQP